MNLIEIEKLARSLSCDEQHALATSLAANLGYELTAEPPHPDAPSAGPFEQLAANAVERGTTVAHVLSDGLCRTLPGGEVYYRPNNPFASERKP